MDTIPESLIHYLEQEMIPCYERFDKAHQVDHVRQVIAESFKLAIHYPVDKKMVYTVAVYHDLGLCDGREKHHLISGMLLRNDRRLYKWFTTTEIETMAQAVEDHRASCGHEPRSIYGRIVAEADRLIRPLEIFRRTIQYGLSHYPELEKEQHYQRYCEHLQEKYAEGGYLKLWIPESDNAAELQKLREIIADNEKKRSMFEQLYTNEII